MTPSPPERLVSVVIPTLNGGDDLLAVVRRTIDVLEPLRPFEVVVVDDGGDAPSWDRIRRMAIEHRCVVAVQLERTSGQIPAFFAGVGVSAGEVVVSLDDDLEVVPEDIPRLLDKIDAGHDMVGGRRTGRTRGRPAARIVLATLFWWVTRHLFGISFRDAGCGMKAFRRPVLLAVMRRGPESMRGIRPVWELSRAALDPTDVPIRWQPSRRPSNYRAADLANLAVDLVRYVLIGRRARRAAAPATPLYVISRTVGAKSGGRVPTSGEGEDLLP
jgi:undecaprenyl-phosphate 4-deoxy-4-formamido-L-arabinose transferase